MRYTSLVRSPFSCRRSHGSYWYSLPFSSRSPHGESHQVFDESALRMGPATISHRGSIDRHPLIIEKACTFWNCSSYLEDSSTLQHRQNNVTRQSRSSSSRAIFRLFIRQQRRPSVSITDMANLVYLVSGKSLTMEMDIDESEVRHVWTVGRCTRSQPNISSNVLCSAKVLGCIRYASLNLFLV